MQTINFSPLEFENFRQQEAEARRRQYGSFSDMFNTIGNTAEKVGAAQQRYGDAQKAEEWRQRQWTNQTYNQYLQNRRYQDERNRQLEERDRQLNEQRLDTEAADRLRQEFMGKYGSQDLSGYGLPAQFAMDRIRNARDWQGVVSGGNALTQAIQYQDTLRNQQDEQAAQKQIANEMEEGERWLANFRARSSLAGYSPSSVGSTYYNIRPTNNSAAESRKVRQARRVGYDELVRYRDELRNRVADLERMGKYSPQVQDAIIKEYEAFNTAVDQWNRRMNAVGKTRW